MLTDSLRSGSAERFNHIIFELPLLHLLW
jgi:hypothetical protein